MISRAIILHKEGFTIREISKKTQLSAPVIERAIQNRKKIWTDKEIDILQRDYGTVELASISKKLGRTEEAITRKAARLGISALDNVGMLTAKELARELNIDCKKVTKKFRECGLNIQEKIVTKKNKFNFIDIQDFWDFVKKNPSLVDLSKLEENVFGKEPIWIKEKRADDFKKTDKKRYQYWSEKDYEKLKILRNMNLSNEEIALEMKRSVSAIRKKINSLNLKKKVVILPWTDVEIEMCIDMRLKGFTYNEIADSLGRTNSSIRWKIGYLKQKGVSL